MNYYNDIFQAKQDRPRKSIAVYYRLPVAFLGNNAKSGPFGLC